MFTGIMWPDGFQICDKRHMRLSGWPDRASSVPRARQCSVHVCMFSQQSLNFASSRLSKKSTTDFRPQTITITSHLTWGNWRNGIL